MRFLDHVPLAFVLGLAVFSLSAQSQQSRLELAAAGLPANLRKAILADAKTFEADLAAIPASDDEYLILIDKRHPLSSDYAPTDLVPLRDTGLSVSRADLSLRKKAFEMAKGMAQAARADGIELVFSSTYRSYRYQEQVFARNAKAMGEKEANRVSARAGQSQHQLGTAIDFGSITNDFAQTKAGRWLTLHAADYGFSLSFPQGWESVTGYSWESWHFRYVGVPAARMQARWFGGIQQYMIEFLDRYRRAKS
jgi:zinc D-Ala-D-Ala carboxypeptidase